jgi:N-acetyl sugar amidotransferase
MTTNTPRQKLRYCTNCLMPSTRPRVTFDERGWCNACAWAEEKRRAIDWPARRKQLIEFRDKYRSQSGNFDCIVPVSGGKDSSYVAYMMKHELGMHPLCVNIIPPLEFDVGRKNVENFIAAGYDCVRIAPNPLVTRHISRRTLIDYGQPLMSWIINVQVAVFKMAINFGISLVMFGEEGETEYGGSSKLKNSPVYDIEDSIRLYLSGVDPKQFQREFTDAELYWWLYPGVDEFRRANLAVAHWSYFEDWDPYQHYLVAKEKCGLQEKEQASVGTYNNFAQTDTCLYDLHTYLMYLKFGFGRCTQDVGIDIRRGALSRAQALPLVRNFDGHYPEEHIGDYLEFFGMTPRELDDVFDKWANKDLFRKVEGRWVRDFEIT